MFQVHFMSLLGPLTSLQTSVDVFLKAVPSPVEVSSIPWTQPAFMLSVLDESTTFISQLKSIVERLSEVHCAHMQCRAILHNAILAHTHLFPAEILGRIFEFVVQSIDAQRNYPELLKQTRYLTHVCSSWRQTAIGWQSLWSQLNFFALKNPHLCRTWMQRSFQAAVDILMSGPDHDYMIRTLLPRIRYLRFYNGNINDLGLSEPTFQRLESLTVSGEYDHYIEDWRMPALRKLHIQHDFSALFMHTSVLSNLQSVMLSSLASASTLSSFLLSLCNLEHLRLYDSAILSNPPEQDTALTLQSLKYLHIHGMQIGSAVFFTRWTCPNLTSLRYDGSYEDPQTGDSSEDSWVAMAEFLRRSPLLESLEIDLGIIGLDWRLAFQILTCHLETSTTSSSPQTLLSNLEALILFDTGCCHLGGVIHAFLEALHQQRHSQTSPSSPNLEVKALDRLQVSDVEYTLGEWEDKVKEMVGSLDIISEWEDDGVNYDLHV